MLYITSLEECFVNQLYNGELDSKRLFCQSPEVWHKTSYTGNVCNTKVDQVLTLKCSQSSTNNINLQSEPLIAVLFLHKYIM
jgi:hypothetical protein